MKKALDYVSDYQLKPACKDAICIAPSKVTQMILAVLEDWYHHIVLTHSCKLVSFLHIYLLFYCQKSANKPDACKKCYRRIRIFTLSLYLEIKSGCNRLQLTSSICQTLNPHLRQMQGSWWYLLYKPRYSPFCLKFCCHDNKVGRGKIQLSAFDGPFPKTLTQMQKILQISLTQAKL